LRGLTARNLFTVVDHVIHSALNFIVSTSCTHTLRRHSIEAVERVGVKRVFTLGNTRCPISSSTVLGRAHHTSTPTTQAAISDAIAPPVIASNPMRDRSDRRVGARELIPPTWMPTLAKFANPHSA